ncbi:MAG TPA: response regulator [Ktedonobacterales bacterium]|nr:response regulator [Ktedonobacterales bacterium]
MLVPAHARTVLVIDDEDAIRDVVRMFLHDEGYAVLEAPNGVVGLNLLRASSAPLVVLLDLMMPRMGGLEVLRALAAEPEIASRHAVIICSATRAFYPADLNFVLPGKRLLDLPKPFDLDDLLAVVEQAAQQLGRDSERDDSEDDTNKVPVAEPAQTPDHDGAEGGGSGEAT